MSLKDLIITTEEKKKSKKLDIDKRSVAANLEDYQRIISYWRQYPDKFIDYLCSLNPDNTFHLLGVQRMYLRISMRYKTVYAVFSRGFSKSFLAVMCLMLKAILYPGSKLATVADGKGLIRTPFCSNVRINIFWIAGNSYMDNQQATK